MTTPVPVVYFDKGKRPRALDSAASEVFVAEALHNSDDGVLHLSALMVVGPVRSPVAVEPGALEPGAVWPSEPHAPTVPPKRRGRPRKTAATPTTVVKPEPVVDARSRAKALEACRAYLQAYPRGGHLARWFREGQQDLRAAELQARARGDSRTSELAETLLALGRGRAEVRAALALPPDFGRVKPEGET